MRRTLAVLFLVNALNIYDRQALGAVLEPLRNEFHLSDRQLGAIPTAFIVVYALAGIPLGRLADRWSRRRLLAAGVAVWGALTALGGLAAGYWTLFVTRMGVGIGEAVCAPSAAGWIADVVPPARRSRAMAVFMMAIPAGILLSFAAGGPLAQWLGWRSALALAAAPAALLAPALLALPEPPAPAKAATPTPARRLFGIRALWWITLSGAIVNFILYAFSYFVAAFLTRFHGVSVARAGVWAGVGSGVAGALGGLAVAAFGGRLRLPAAAALAAALLSWLALRVPQGNPAVAVVLLMIAYGAWQMYYGPVYAAIQDAAPPDLRATAMALYFVGMYLCGGAFGPLLVGALSDRFAAAAGAGEAARAVGLHQALYVLPLASVALAAVLWQSDRASRRRPA